MSNPIVIEPINTNQAEEAKDQAQVILTNAQSIIIKTQVDYDQAAGILQNIKARIKALDTLRKSITKPLDEAKKRVMDMFDLPILRYQDAESTIKQALLTYADEQEKQRKAEEAKFQAAADKKRAELDAKAAAAVAAGDMDKADKYANKAAQVIAPTLAPRVEQAKGIHFMEKWTANVIDFAKLPDEFKMANMSLLNKTAQATKGAIKIPGITWTMTKVVAAASSAQAVAE
jgi:tetratricopeptide (TPR) repeat protein